REAELGAKPLAPGEQLARVHAMPLGHRVHGLARHQGLRDQPALVLVRPAPSRLPAKDLDPRHPLAPRTSLTTRCKTSRRDDSPEPHLSLKAAFAGRVRIT